MSDNPVSKILVLERAGPHLATISRFCGDNNLVALKVRRGTVMSVLRTNIDLGGILYSDDYEDTPEQTARVALEIHAARPELPIFIRRKSAPTMAGLDERTAEVYCAAYVIDDMQALRGMLDRYIFCLMYPNALLRGICEITESAMRGQFKSLSIAADTPYIVHDRVIHGELLSLMPLESGWCRGYMMLQAEEEPFRELIARERPDADGATFRGVNDLLSETTNLIWGSFKNRYIGEIGSTALSQVQVPIIINHQHKYMSFGTGNPQLCFRFRLQDTVTGRRATLYERFIFNISWSPEDFREITHDSAQLVESGELQLF